MITYDSWVLKMLLLSREYLFNVGLWNSTTILFIWLLKNELKLNGAMIKTSDLWEIEVGIQIEKYTYPIIESIRFARFLKLMKALMLIWLLVHLNYHNIWFQFLYQLVKTNYLNLTVCSIVFVWMCILGIFIEAKAPGLVFSESLRAVIELDIQVDQKVKSLTPPSKLGSPLKKSNLRDITCLLCWRVVVLLSYLCSLEGAWRRSSSFFKTLHILSIWLLIH